MRSSDRTKFFIQIPDDAVVFVENSFRFVDRPDSAAGGEQKQDQNHNNGSHKAMIPTNQATIADVGIR